MAVGDGYPLDVKIPEPNEALGAVLVSNEIRSSLQEVAETGLALWREEVAKRTGRLAASGRVSTEIGPVFKGQDRWIGVVTIGGQGSAGTVFYALAHEFGWEDEEGQEHVGAEELLRVAELLSVAGRL